jgi:uncharacterized protein involved in exopolysaccharide biosynthesis
MSVMLPPYEPETVEDDVVDPRVLVRQWRAIVDVLRRNRPRLLQGAFAGAVIGLVIAVLLRPEFRSVARLLPYRTPGMGAGLSGLAGLAGVRLPAGLTEQTVTPELFPELVRSLDFRVALAGSRVRIASLDRTMPVVDYLRFLADSTWRGQAYSYTLGLPGIVIDRMSAGQVMRPAPIPGDTVAPPSYSLEYMKRLEELEERVDVAYDKKTSLVTITVDLPDAVAAAQLAGLVSSRLMSTIVRYETSKASEQFAYLRRQHERGRLRYERAQDELARFTDRNRGLTSAVALVERSRLEREVNLSFEVFGELSRQLEQVGLKVNQDTPAFTVLEHPVIAPKKSSPRRAVLVLTGAMVGLVAAATLLLARWWMGRA